MHRFESPSRMRFIESSPLVEQSSRRSTAAVVLINSRPILIGNLNFKSEHTSVSKALSGRNPLSLYLSLSYHLKIEAFDKSSIKAFDLNFEFQRPFNKRHS